MRDLIVTIVILILVFVPGYYSERYLENSGNHLIERLNVIKEETEEDKMENMAELLDIKKQWDEMENMWNIVSNHQNTDNIELSFTRLIISYGEKEKAEILVNLAEIITMVEDTPRGEKIDWVNIF